MLEKNLVIGRTTMTEFLKGTVTDDVFIIDNSGPNEIYTGKGHDTIIFSKGWSADSIHDFDPLNDKIDLSSYGNLTPNDITLNNEGNGSSITILGGEKTIHFQNVNLTQDDVNNFIYSKADSILSGDIILGNNMGWPTTSNYIVGGSGQDVLISEGWATYPTSVLIGSCGKDIFVFPHDNQKTVVDFHHGEDVVYFDRALFQNITIANDGNGGSIISYNDPMAYPYSPSSAQLTLANVAPSSLTEDDFYGALGNIHEAMFI